MDIKLPEDIAHRYGDIIAKHVTKAADGFRRLFFVDNMIATLKVLWRFLFIKILPHTGGILIGHVGWLVN